MKTTIVCVLMMILCSCGGTSENASTSNVVNSSTPIKLSPPNSNLPIPNNSGLKQYKILLIGNSHVSGNGLGSMIKSLIELSIPDSEVQVSLSPGGGYLVDRINDGLTYEKLLSESWTHVILQAQKYSQSGAVSYSTVAAQEWIHRVKSLGATPILFPEHPQRGNSQEGQQVHDIHLSIVKEQKSCLAPIGLGWNLILSEQVNLQLHAADGNHANLTGSYFTALIFYQVISGELADAAPIVNNLNVDSSLQDLLGAYASQIIDQHQPCEY